MKMISGSLPTTPQGLLKGIFFPDDNVRNEVISGDIVRYGYTNKSFSVGLQNGVPYSVVISTDGTNMYVISNQQVFQYTLSTPFEINTATYANKSLSFGSIEGNGQGLSISNDGVNLYINGNTNDRIVQYVMTTPWDLATAKLPPQVKTLVVSSQGETEPHGMSFGDSGTKLYVVGNTNDTIYQYTLSTAYDVSTATYANKSYYVGAVDSFPTGIDFKPDGTRFYIQGGSNARLYQFTCTTPWDISTARYLLTPSPVFSGVGTVGEQQPTGMYVGDSGTKLYIIGNWNDTIYQYTLSTPYDVSTATYASKSFLITSQTSYGTGIFFKPDGTKAYISDGLNDRVFEYILTTAWDISTASHLPSFSISLASQESLVTGMAFKSDGTAVYVIGTNNDTIYQYTLSTAWDVSTASYASKSFSVNAQDTSPRGITFKTDGTKVYVMGDTNDRVYQYSLSTAWDISTASYDSKSFLVSGQDSAGNDLYFKTDGAKMYILGDTNNRVYEYTLSTAWDVSTATSSTNVAVQTETLTGLTFNSDGTSFYVIGTTNDVVYQYNMSTAWLVSSATLVSQTVRPTILQDTSPVAISFNSDGTKIFLLGDSNDRIYQYEVSTAYTTSTMNVGYVPMSSTSYECRDLAFSSDGTKLYLAQYSSGSTDYIEQYNLSVAWNISTAVTSYFLTSPDTIPEAISFKSDGTKLYVLGGTNDKIYQYTLSTPWSLSTATQNTLQNVTYVGLQDISPTGMHFNADGTRVYVLGDNTDRIYQYEIEDAWNMNSMNMGYFPISNIWGSASYTIRDIKFKPDGTRFFCPIYAPSTTDYIAQFTLTANAWNICALSSTSASISSPDIQPEGIALKSDGTRLYMVGLGNDRIYEYTLSVPWDLGSGTVTQQSHNHNGYIGYFETEGRALEVSADGTKIYVIGSGSDTVFQMDMTTPWILDTMNVGFKSLAGQEGTSYGHTMSYDGSKVYVIGANDTIYQYSLTTPFNLGSFSYESKSLSISAVSFDARDLFINKNGTKIYTIDQSQDRVYQYNLSTPFDITTATYSTKNISIVTNEITGEGLTFSQNLDRLYVVGTNSDTVYQYDFNF
jgi:6-phosphogluconolactonase (cycloisomerase 2 family)